MPFVLSWDQGTKILSWPEQPGAGFYATNEYVGEPRNGGFNDPAAWFDTAANVNFGTAGIASGSYYVWSGNDDYSSNKFVWDADSQTGSLEDFAPPATAPSAPTLTGTAGIESIMFTWFTPGDDGGSAITKYTLYLDGVLHTDDVTSPTTITGLPAGVLSGPWTLTATNAVGESDPSNEVNETPLAASAGPTTAQKHYWLLT